MYKKMINKKIILIAFFVLSLIFFVLWKYPNLFNFRRQQNEQKFDNIDINKTYKKAVDVLPYHLNPLKKATYKDKTERFKKNNVKKTQIEILNFLKTPFLNITSDISQLQNESEITDNKKFLHYFSQKYSTGICEKISFQDKRDNIKKEFDLNKNEEGIDLFKKSDEIQGFNIYNAEIEFSLKDDLKFDNGMPIDTDTIEYSLKQYINDNTTLLFAENAIFFWLLKLKDAYSYMLSTRDNRKLTCFRKINDKKFVLIFEDYYIRSDSLKKIISYLNTLWLFPKDVPLIEGYGYPINKDKIFSYGPYKIKDYNSNEKILLQKNINNNYKIENILYQIVPSYEERLKLFKEEKLNELEISDCVGFDNIVVKPNNKMTMLLINQRNRNDQGMNSRRFTENSDIKNQKLSSVLKYNDFKLLLSKIIDKQQISGTNLNNDEISKLVSNIYNDWKQENSNQDKILLELVCDDRNRMKKIASEFKKKIEDIFKINGQSKLQIELKFVPIQFGWGEESNHEFQNCYDLLVTNIILKKNKFKFYTHLLEKIGLDDRIQFDLSFIELEKNNAITNNDRREIEIIKKELQIKNIDPNGSIYVDFEKFKTIYRKIIRKDFFIKDDIKNKFINSMLNILEKIIKSQNCFYYLSEDESYWVYSNIKHSIDQMNFYDLTDILKSEEFYLSTK